MNERHSNQSTKNTRWAPIVRANMTLLRPNAWYTLDLGFSEKKIGYVLLQEQLEGPGKPVVYR